MRRRCNVTLLVGVVLVTLTTGCKKRVAVAPPAPTPVQEVKAPTPKVAVRVHYCRAVENRIRPGGYAEVDRYGCNGGSDFRAWPGRSRGQTGSASGKVHQL